MPLFLLIVPVIFTLLGGLLALRFRRSLVFLSALGAGLLLGAAFLDLLPEALSLGGTPPATSADVLGITLVSFLIFFAIQNFLGRFATQGVSAQALRKVGGTILIFHSFRDGMAIGLAYAASHPAGYAVAAGIAAHDIADGVNTVVLTTGGKNPTRSDYLFLAADCVAPLLGGLLTIWWTLSRQSSIVMLAGAAGFFIQMAASDFLPEIRRNHPQSKVVLPAVLCGAGIIYVANRLIGASL